jgi:hypothetical protein
MDSFKTWCVVYGHVVSSSRVTVVFPGILFGFCSAPGGGSTNQFEDIGQRELESGGR